MRPPTPIALPDQISITIGGITCGAQPDARGPIGGESGYHDIITRGDFHVATIDELRDALTQAQPGQVVLIAPEAELDLTEWVYTDELVLTVPAGVTLAGDRGHDGAPGPLIFSDALQTKPLIQAGGEDVRITGLRLCGPDPKRRLAFHYRCFYAPDAPGHEAYYRLPNSTGIHSEHHRLTVDNCEVAGFSHTGILLANSQGHEIHHNFIHHCQRMGLGYGLGHIGSAHSRITHNLFQDNKHDVAGTGEPDQSYVARHNVILAASESHAHPITGEPYGQDHTFDMHGGRDRGDGTTIAGHTIEISHNTVFTPYTPVTIRGIPQRQATIHHNWFAQQADITHCVITDGQTTIEDNALGANRTQVT